VKQAKLRSKSTYLSHPEPQHLHSSYLAHVTLFFAQTSISRHYLSQPDILFQKYKKTHLNPFGLEFFSEHFLGSTSIHKKVVKIIQPNTLEWLHHLNNLISLYKTGCLYLSTRVPLSQANCPLPILYRPPHQLREGSKHKYDPAKANPWPWGTPNSKTLADHGRKNFTLQNMHSIFPGQRQAPCCLVLNIYNQLNGLLNDLLITTPFRWSTALIWNNPLMILSQIPSKYQPHVSHGINAS